MRLAICCALFGVLTCAAETRFVDGSASPNGDGLSWATAYVELQDALDAARLNAAIDAIHVASGAYLPDRGTLDPNESFNLVNGVTVLGGFPAGGGPLSSRDPLLHETTLTGDLLGDDNPPDSMGFLSGNSENTRHVVRAQNCGSATLLDGFTIRGGHASGSSANERNGGNMLIQGGGPIIRNCVFLRARASWMGGGLAAVDAAVQIDSCTFRENVGNQFGGGLAIMGTAAADVRDCRFKANVGGGGAGMYCGPTNIINGGGNTTSVQDCTFDGNRGVIGATAGGGIMFIAGDNDVRRCRFVDNIVNGGGGIYVKRGDALIEQCQFFRNRGDGDGGGAIYVEDFSASTPFFTTDVVSCMMAGNAGAVVGVGTNVNLVNCTLAHNYFPEDPPFFSWPAVLSQTADFTVTNAIVWGNADLDFWGGSRDFLAGEPRYTVQNSIIEQWDGQLAGTAIADEPNFFDAVGPDGELFSQEDNNYRLRLDSPALDGGSDASLPPGSIADAEGLARSTDGDGDGLAVVDMGALERCRVDLNCDAVADAQDTATLAAALLGPAVTSALGDLTADAVTDLADCAEFQRLFAEGCARP